MKQILFFSLAILGLAFSSCTYTLKPPITGNISKISVPMFKNNTLRTGIEEKLTNALIEEFTLDQRIEVARSGNADATLHGTIIGYNLDAIDFDKTKQTADQSSQEFKLTLIIDVSVIDKDGKQLIRQTFQENTNYSRSLSLVKTEDQAFDELSNRMVKQIMTAVIQEEW